MWDPDAEQEPHVLDLVAGWLRENHALTLSEARVRAAELGLSIRRREFEELRSYFPAAGGVAPSVVPAAQDVAPVPAPSAPAQPTAPVAASPAPAPVSASPAPRRRRPRANPDPDRAPSPPLRAPAGLDNLVEQFAAILDERDRLRDVLEVIARIIERAL